MGQLVFSTTGFFVEDVPATMDFYRRAFGMKERYVHPSWGYGELEQATRYSPSSGSSLSRTLICRAAPG